MTVRSTATGEVEVYKLIALWSAPQAADVDEFERRYLDGHVRLAAAVPGMRELTLTRADAGPEGSERGARAGGRRRPVHPGGARQRARAAVPRAGGPAAARVGRHALLPLEPWQPHRGAQRRRGRPGPERMAAAAKANPSGRTVDFDDVTALAEYLASPAATMIQGQTVMVDGGLTLR
jgi:hypothetical protein